MSRDRRPLGLLRGTRSTGSGSGSGEVGSALIYALILITILILIVTALFGYAQTGSKSVQSFRIDRDLRYQSDGAIQAGIVLAKANGTYGRVADDPDCVLRFDIEEPAKGNGNNDKTRNAFVANSFLMVSCGSTPGTPTPAIGEPRDITFTVTCGTRTITNGLMTCDNGTSSPAATARVQFTLCTLPTCATDVWVPKVVSWKLNR